MLNQTNREESSPVGKNVEHARAPSSTAIVLVTVNEHETNALLNIFIGENSVPPTVVRGGVTYYDLGNHGGHRIVHTVSEMGAGGVGASQQRTREAIEHWKPRAVIGVGIAFGLDETKQQIGDVLVSTQIQDYELGRLNENGTLTARGDKPSSADALRNRFRQADIVEQRRGGGWPKVRFGLILSGQKLIDNLDYRENLKRLFTEALGGEMEGGGVYTSATSAKVDWIIVKAICDWGHNKNQADKDSWQCLAATNAARVVKAALDIGELYPENETSLSWIEAILGSATPVRFNHSPRAFELPKIVDTRFPNRCPQLFCREDDIITLRKRCGNGGATILYARPRMGKTWTVHEVGRRCREEGFLVGYHECEPQSEDNLLACVANLYASWIGDSSRHREIATRLTEREPPPIVREFFSVLSSYLPVTPVTTADELSAATVSAMRMIMAPYGQFSNWRTAGGSNSYSTLGEILRFAASTSGSRCVLLLDAWEQSRGLQGDQCFFANPADRSSGWQLVHVIFASRSGEPAQLLAERMASGNPQVEVVPLEPICFNEIEARRLRDYLADTVAVTAKQTMGWLIREIAGFPGVIAQWVAARSRIQSRRELANEARAAHNYRYLEFDVLIPSLSVTERKIAMRMALMPSLSPRMWENFRLAVFRDIPEFEKILDELYFKGVFEGPNGHYGHLTRYIAANEWFRSHSRYKEAAREELKALIEAFAVAPDDHPDYYTERLAFLAVFDGVISQYHLGPYVEALIIAAHNMVHTQEHHATALLLEVEPPRTPSNSLFLHGLIRTGYLRKENGDWPGTAKIVDRLRYLASLAPEDETRWTALATALFNSSFDSHRGNSRPEAIAEARHTLVSRFTGVVGLPRCFAEAVIEIGFQENSETGKLRLRANLDELCGLGRQRRTTVISELLVALTCANEAELGQAKVWSVCQSDKERMVASLALGVGYIYRLSVSESKEQANSVIGALRNLRETAPNKEVPAIMLAQGLRMAHEGQDCGDLKGFVRDYEIALRTLTAELNIPGVASEYGRVLFGYCTTSQQELALEENALTELDRLTSRFPSDVTVRKCFLNASLNCLNDYRERKEFARRNDVLRRILNTYRAFPTDHSAQQNYALALRNTLKFSVDDPDYRWRELIFDLEEVYNACADNPSVVREFARGLVSASIFASEEGDIQRTISQLNRLRKLYLGHSKADGIGDSLSRTLANSIARVKGSQYSETRIRWFWELRNLATDHGESCEVQIDFANACDNVLSVSGCPLSAGERIAMLVTLREAVLRNPKQSRLAEIYAPLLATELGRAKASDYRDTMLSELRRLSATYPNADAIQGALATALYNGFFANQRTDGELGVDASSFRHELKELLRRYPRNARVAFEYVSAATTQLNNAALSDKELRTLICEALGIYKLHADCPVASTRGGLAEAAFFALVAGKEMASKIPFDSGLANAIEGTLSLIIKYGQVSELVCHLLKEHTVTVKNRSETH